MMVRVGVVSAFAVLLLGWTGCKDSNNPIGPDGSPSNVIFPASNVSYGSQVQPLFNQACNFVGCHDDGDHTSPLKLTSYANVRYAMQQVVIPGKPEQSILVLRIQGTTAGERMPPNTNPLNQNQINGIRTWIAEGANNN